MHLFILTSFSEIENSTYDKAMATHFLYQIYAVNSARENCHTDIS